MEGLPACDVDEGLLMPAQAPAAAAVASASSFDKNDRHQVEASQVESEKTPDSHKKRADVWDYCASLPLSERQAYTEALLKSPEVVRSESDPLRFWEREHGDVALAGQRLVRYWKHRKDRLGSERYHKRLDLTEDGALDADTISAVKRGFLSFLPNDAQGRTVLYFDHALASRELDGLGSRDARIRAEFYMLHSALERGQPLTLVRYSETAQIDKAKMNAFQEYWTFAPYQLDSVYFAYKPPPGAKRIFKATIAPLVAQHLSNLLKVVRDHKTVFSSTPSELLRKLPQALAGDGSGLPAELGGTYDAAAHHATWFQTQIQNDCHIRELQFGDAKLPAAVIQAAAPVDGNKGQNQIHLSPPPAPLAQHNVTVDVVEVTDDGMMEALLPAASEAEELAQAAAAEPARSSIDSILDPAPEESGELKAEPVTEEDRVSPALAPSKPPSSRVDRDRLLQERRTRKRKKDLAYSRDRRRKEKDEMDGLQEQVKALSKVNDGLRREEARLAILLVNSQNEVAEATGQPVLSLGNNGWVEPPRPPTAAGAGLEIETQLQNMWAEEACRPPVVRSSAVAAPHRPQIPQETLLLALERLQQEQQQQEQLLQLQQLQQREKQRHADELASLGTASLEWEVVSLLQQRQAELDARKLLLQRIGQRNGMAAPPPPLREELTPPLALQSLLQQHEERRRKQALLDNLTRAELSQRRTAPASVVKPPDLVRLLLEEQAATAARARDAATLEMSRPVYSANRSAPPSLPEEPGSSSQLLQLLRSAQAPSRRPVAPPAVAPTPILSEDDAMLLRLLAANRR